MKKSNVWMILLIGSVVFSNASAYNALYAFGDGICTTTSNSPSPSLQKFYYGKRSTNGRTWVEVLAQRQGLAYDASKNLSGFGNYSPTMIAGVKQFVAPADATNDLFVVWAGDADFVGFMGSVYPSLKISDWNSAIGQSLTNHYTIITNLYAKGVRTLIVPNAVDITEIPAYNQMGTSVKSVVRGRTIYFNTNLLATVNRAKAACPGLTVYVPDIFSLLDNVITNAAYYGLTNVTSSGQPIDAITYYGNAATTNGLGTNFIFWDPTDITAKMHAVLADTVQQIISPVQICGLAQDNGINEVDMMNIPVGLNGFLEGCTNLGTASWTTVTNFSSLATAQSVFVPTPPLPPIYVGSGGGGGLPDPTNTNNISSSTNAIILNTSSQLYRLRFPYAWNWP